MKTRSGIFAFAAIFFILTVTLTNSQPTGLNEHSVRFETVLSATLVGEDGLAMRTEDGGNTWDSLNTGVSTLLKSNDFIVYDNGPESMVSLSIAVGENGVIIKSTDNGLTWVLKTSGTTENLNSVVLLSKDAFYVCGDNGTILVSADHGETWSALTSGVTVNLNDIMFAKYSAGSVTELHGFAVGDNGTILFTQDYGITWTELASGVTENLLSVYVLTDSYMAAAGTGGVMVLSQNNGETWSEVTTGTTENINDLKFLGEDVVVASCDNGFILRSPDLGTTWSVITTGSENNLYAVNFADSQIGITVGQNGTELYTTDAGMNWVNKEAALIRTMNTVNAKSVKLMQNYPNPFNPSTKINYELSFNASVTVKIYDMIGKEVTTLANSYQRAGTYTVNFDASNLSSGIYFYVLRASTGSNEVVKTMRMILTK